MRTPAIALDVRDGEQIFALRYMTRIQLHIDRGSAKLSAIDAYN